MGSYDHTAQHPFGSHRHLRAIVETAHRLAFCTLLDLIGGQVQTRLNERMIQHAVLFATGHKGKASHIGEHSPGAILAVEPQQGALLWDLVRCEVARNRCETLAQFLSVASVAPVAKTAEPLETVGLTDDGTSPDDFPSLAPRVASRTDLLQPAKGWWQLFG